MDIAVVIPLFNGAKWIRQTLETVLAQSHPPAEIVVVDDGSEDDSSRIVQGFSGLSLINNPDKGPNFARNFGLQHTTAPFVTFLDQDDILHPDHLKLLSSILMAHPECPAVLAGIRNFRSDETLSFKLPKMDLIPCDPWRSFPFNMLGMATPSGVLIRRIALDSMGGWQTQFPCAGDYYNWLRLSVSAPLVRNKDATVGYRCHNSSHSSLLLKGDVQQYLSLKSAAAQDALRYRLELCPQDAERLTTRMRVFDIMSDILKALIENNDRLLMGSALAFGKYLLGQSPEFIESGCWTLVWYLYPKTESHPLIQQRVVWNILSEHWPDSASYIREAVLSWMPS